MESGRWHQCGKRGTTTFVRLVFSNMTDPLISAAYAIALHPCRPSSRVEAGSQRHARHARYASSLRCATPERKFGVYRMKIARCRSEVQKRQTAHNSLIFFERLVESVTHVTDDSTVRDSDLRRRAQTERFSMRAFLFRKHHCNSSPTNLAKKVGASKSRKRVHENSVISAIPTRRYNVNTAAQATVPAHMSPCVPPLFITAAA